MKSVTLKQYVIQIIFKNPEKSTCIFSLHWTYPTNSFTVSVKTTGWSKNKRMRITGPDSGTWKNHDRQHHLGVCDHLLRLLTSSITFLSPLQLLTRPKIPTLARDGEVRCSTSLCSPCMQTVYSSKLRIYIRYSLILIQTLKKINHFILRKNTAIYWTASIGNLVIDFPLLFSLNQWGISQMYNKIYFPIAKCSECQDLCVLKLAIFVWLNDQNRNDGIKVYLLSYMNKLSKNLKVVYDYICNYQKKQTK